MEDQIIKFFGLIEKETQTLEYGTMTINVYVNKGLPVTSTVNMVKSKRKRYKVKNLTDPYPNDKSG